MTVDYGEFPRPSSQPSAPVVPSFLPSTINPQRQRTQPQVQKPTRTVSVLLSTIHPYERHIAQISAPVVPRAGFQTVRGHLQQTVIANVTPPTTVTIAKETKKPPHRLKSNQTYHHDETVDKIAVRSLDDALLRVGKEVELEVTVWSAQNTTTRNNPNKWSVAHVYYAPKLSQTILCGNIHGRRLWRHPRCCINSPHE